MERRGAGGGGGGVGGKLGGFMFHVGVSGNDLFSCNLSGMQFHHSGPEMIEQGAGKPTCESITLAGKKTQSVWL